MKPRVHDSVVRSLAQRIISGDCPPGSTLPPEADLCAELSISRSALREGVRVLAGKGLLSARPRTGTLVRSRDDWNLLDEELLGWSIDLGPNPELVRGLLEARLVVEPAAARFAATRASDDEIAALGAAFTRMEAAAAQRDVSAFNTADVDFHKALLRASGNLVFRQLAKTIGAALLYSFRLSNESPSHRDAALPSHLAVLERVRDRDPEGAAAAMARVIDIAAAPG